MEMSRLLLLGGIVCIGWFAAATSVAQVGGTVSSSDAQGGTLLSINPDPTTTNDFTVTGSYTGTRRHVSLTLTETGPSGHTQEFPQDSRSFSQRIRNRANGEYSYVLTGCYQEQVSTPEGAVGARDVYEVCERVGGPLTVTVEGPERDSVGTQLDDTWQVHVGDFDGDGLKDVYLKRTSEAVGGGLLRDIVLWQTPGGMFSVEPAPPGSTNASVAATWPVSKDLYTVKSDIDWDGFVDVTLRRLSRAVGNDVPDQMVFAPGRRPAVVLKAFDDDVQRFVDEIDAWFGDPTYFENRAHENTSLTASHRTECRSEHQSGSDDNVADICLSTPIIDSPTGQTPTNLSTAARTFAEQFDVNEGRIDPDVTPGSRAAIIMSRTLKLVVGIEVFGGRLEKACIGSFTYEDRLDIPCDRPDLIGRTLLGYVLDAFGSQGHQ